MFNIELCLLIQEFAYCGFYPDALADALERDIKSSCTALCHVSSFVQSAWAQSVASRQW